MTKEIDQRITAIVQEHARKKAANRTLKAKIAIASSPILAPIGYYMLRELQLSFYQASALCFFVTPISLILWAGIIFETFDYFNNEHVRFRARLQDALHDYPDNVKTLNLLTYDQDLRELCAKYTAEELLCVFNDIPLVNADDPESQLSNLQLLFPTQYCYETFSLRSYFYMFKLPSLCTISQPTYEVLSKFLPADIINNILSYIRPSANQINKLKEALEESYTELEEYHFLDGNSEPIEECLRQPIIENKKAILTSFDTIFKKAEDYALQDAQRYAVSGPRPLY